MKPTLTILTGERAGEKITIAAAKTYIFGRDNVADIPLLEKKISRRHSSIRWEKEDAKLILEDLRSLNGTFVNGTAISEPHELQDRDRFQIGSFLFEVNLGAKKEVITSISSAKSRTGESKVRKTDPSLVPSAEELFDSNPATDGSSISGKLADVPLPDLLQMLAATKKSGRLVITANKKELMPTPPAGCPSLYIKNGKLVGAELGEFRNEEAFYEILRWNNGYFSLFSNMKFELQSTIEVPLEALLLEGFRRMDEEKTATMEFHAETTFDVRLEEPLSNLEPDELRVFQLVWRKKKMAAIWSSSHLDQKSTDAMIRKLFRAGYIKKI